MLTTATKQANRYPDFAQDHSSISEQITDSDGRRGLLAVKNGQSKHALVDQHDVEPSTERRIRNSLGRDGVVVERGANESVIPVAVCKRVAVVCQRIKLSREQFEVFAAFISESHLN